jgi:hypothetical protein
MALRGGKAVLAGYDWPTGEALQILSGLPGDAAPGLGRGLIIRHAGGVHALCDLAGGELGQRCDDQLGARPPAIDMLDTVDRPDHSKTFIFCAGCQQILPRVLSHL